MQTAPTQTLVERARAYWQKYYDLGEIPSMDMEYAFGRIAENEKRFYDEAMGQMMECIRKRINIPQFYQEAEIETGKLSRFILNRTKNGKSSYIYGQFVPEKTYAACAVIKELALYEHQDCLYFSASELDALGTADSDYTLSDIIGTKILVLDELDSIDLDSNFGKALSYLAKITDKRRGKTTIYTSNLSYAGLKGVLARKKPEVAQTIINNITTECKTEIRIGPDERFSMGAA